MFYSMYICTLCTFEKELKKMFNCLVISLIHEKKERKKNEKYEWTQFFRLKTHLMQIHVLHSVFSLTFYLISLFTHFPFQWITHSIAHCTTVKQILCSADSFLSDNTSFCHSFLLIVFRYPNYPKAYRMQIFNTFMF